MFFLLGACWLPHVYVFVWDAISRCRHERPHDSKCLLVYSTAEATWFVKLSWFMETPGLSGPVKARDRQLLAFLGSWADPGLPFRQRECDTGRTGSCSSLQALEQATVKANLSRPAHRWVSCGFRSLHSPRGGQESSLVPALNIDWETQASITCTWSSIRRAPGE